MGTSWTKRHEHETKEYQTAERKRYDSWKSQFTDKNGKWSESLVRAWMNKRKEEKQ